MTERFFNLQDSCKYIIIEYAQLHLHRMDRKLSDIYYSHKGYWKDLAAVKKLSKAAKVSDEVPLAWLKKQAIWQISLPPPRYILRLIFDEDRPNAVHQTDLLFLSHDRVGRKTNKYACQSI